MKKAFVVFLFALFATLAAAAVTEQQANASLQDAQTAIAEMNAAHFGITQVSDIFILLNYSYVNKNYENVLTRTADIQTIHDRSFQINDSLLIFEDKMQKYIATGLNISAAETIFMQAKNEFGKEMYDTAEGTLANAYKKLEEIKTENVMSQTILEAGKRNIATFIKENILYIILAAIIIFFVAILVYSRFEILVARRKLGDLELERSVIFELMKKAQIECYQKRELSYDEYKAKMTRFKERLVHINEELPAVKLKAVQELPSLGLGTIIDAIPLRRKR